MRIGVIGTGSWATALVHTFVPHFESIYWFWPSEEDRSYILQNQKNPRYLQNITLNLSKVELTGKGEELVENSDLVLMLTPSAFLKKILDRYFQDSYEKLQEKPVISGIKGFEQTTGLPITQYLEKKMGIKVTGCLSGPAHAEEVIQGKYTVITLASLHYSNEWMKEFFNRCSKVPHLTVIQSDDPLGIEYAAILKNVYAILIGYLKGKGIGDNFIAATMCSCLDEMETLLQHFHPHPLRQLIHSAYLGDFLVTAYSEHSRNRRLGELRGRGYSLEKAFEKMKMVAEGYYSIQILIQNYRIQAPLLSLVYELLITDIPTGQLISRIPCV